MSQCIEEALKGVRGWTEMSGPLLLEWVSSAASPQKEELSGAWRTADGSLEKGTPSANVSQK